MRERTGPTLPGIAPSNVYPTSDGQVLIAANQDSVFRRLVDVMGMPELATDPRFVDHRARGRNMHAIDTIIAGWTERFGAAELLDKLHAAGVPAGLVYEPKDMLADPHFQRARLDRDRQGRAARRADDAGRRAAAVARPPGTSAGRARRSAPTPTPCSPACSGSRPSRGGAARRTA